MFILNVGDNTYKIYQFNMLRRYLFKRVIKSSCFWECPLFHLFTLLRRKCMCGYCVCSLRIGFRWLGLRIQTHRLIAELPSSISQYHFIMTNFRIFKSRGNIIFTQFWLIYHPSSVMKVFDLLGEFKKEKLISCRKEMYI